MSLPQPHLESLQRQLDVHEERLTLLRGELDRVSSDDARQSAVPAGARAHASDVAREKLPRVRKREWIANRRGRLEREIRIHEQLIALGRDRKVLDALRELAGNREYAREVARDPAAAARERGIELPAGMVLRVDLEPERVRLEVNYYEDLFPFMVTWNSDTGFSPPGGAGASRQQR